MLAKLIKLANNLDKKGLFEEAGELDVIIQSLAADEEYEKQLREFYEYIGAPVPERHKAVDDTPTIKEMMEEGKKMGDGISEEEVQRVRELVDTQAGIWILRGSGAWEMGKAVRFIPKYDLFGNLALVDVAVEWLTSGEK